MQSVTRTIEDKLGTLGGWDTDQPTAVFPTKRIGEYVVLWAEKPNQGHEEEVWVTHAVTIEDGIAHLHNGNYRMRYEQAVAEALYRADSLDEVVSEATAHIDVRDVG